MEDDELLAEQRAFYRRRAPEYDEWWLRQGRYDRGAEQTVLWNDQVAVLEAALDRINPTGDVLELAGGTGWWTQRLARTARSLTVVDASPEALELNRARVRRADIDYVEADVFGWEPSRRYDLVFFSFWLSHVPRPRFEGFWDLVGRCLRPGGQAFLIDNRHDPTVGRPDPYVVDASDDVQRRRLSDGSEHRMVKVFYEPEELERRLAEVGWAGEIGGTRWFIFGGAHPM